MAPLSIVIPVHNRASLVLRTLKCVKAQTFRPLKLILVDNNSTDDSKKVLQQWKSANEEPNMEVVVVEESKPGASAARNRGLQEVTTDYTMFFDSDDEMAPTHVERAMSAFLSPSHPDIVGWDVVYAGHSGERTTKRFSTRHSLWHNIMHGSMSTQRYAAKTSLFRRAGGWNNDIFGWDDIELGCRMLLLNPSVKKIHGAPTVTVNRTAISITGTSRLSGLGKWETSLNAIECSLQKAGRSTVAVNLRRALLAGKYVHENGGVIISEASTLLDEAVAKTPSKLCRLLLKCGFHYTASGGRAFARLIFPLFINKY